MEGFVNPGAAVASTLQDILARQAKDRHDRLMESISLQNAGTSRMQAESNEKEREAVARWRDAQANKDRLNDMVMGQDLSDDDANWLSQAGYGGLMKKEGGGELVDGEQGPIQPEKRTFLGTSKQQLQAKQEEAINNLLTNEDFKNADPLTQTVMARAAGWANFDPSKIARVDKAEHSPIYIEYQDYLKSFKPTKQQPEPLDFNAYQTADANRKAAVARSSAPRPAPLPKYTWVQDANDPDRIIGTPTNGTDFVVRRLSELAQQGPTQGDVPLDKPPVLGSKIGTAPKPTRPFVDQQLVNELNRVRQQRAAAIGSAQKGGNKVTAEQALTYNQMETTAKQQIVSSLQNVGPETKKALLTLSTDPNYSKMSASQIVEAMKQKQQLDPDVEQQLLSVLPLLNGQ